jgi:hypothetical protein
MQTSNLAVVSTFSVVGGLELHCQCSFEEQDVGSVIVSYFESREKSYCRVNDQHLVPLSIEVLTEDEDNAPQTSTAKPVCLGINGRVDKEEVSKTLESSKVLLPCEKDELCISEAEAWLQRNVMVQYWNGVTNSYAQIGGRCSSISVDW